MSGTSGSAVAPGSARVLGEVPCYDADDARVAERIKARLPVVMRGSRLARPAVERWRVPYLKQHITSTAPFTVFASRSNFLYCDPAKNGGRWAFTPRIRKVDMPFPQFAAEFRRRCDTSARTSSPGAGATDGGARGVGEGAAASPAASAPAAGAGGVAGAGATAHTPGTAPASASADRIDSGAATSSDASGGDGGDPGPAGASGDTASDGSDGRGPAADELIYLQQSLFAGIGDQILADFKQFGFDEALKWSSTCSWGPLTTNLLLIGEKGCITPFHYDEQQNLFAQVEGRKRVLLAPPEDFHCMYPYPVGHPADRQSQVDFYEPDLKSFPRYGEAHISSVLLHPGDVLYLPMYWWHQMESNLEPTTSVTFWFTAGKRPAPKPPITDSCSLVAMRRNIEKLLGSSPSYVASADLLTMLDRGESPTTTAHRQALAAVIKLVTMALGSADRVDEFVRTLVANRFRHLPRLGSSS